MKSLPTSSKVVVIGGGIVGCSTAYHLARMGVEVTLLERKKLTSGTTFHAAGLVGQLRTSANVTQLLGYSVDLYKRLEVETGQATGWKMNGGLRLACNQDRWTEVKRQATTAHSFGLDMHLLTPQEAQDLWPLMDIGDLVGAAFLPTDGQANPSDITLSLAKGARMAGAQIHEEVKVLSIDIQGGVIKAVVTEQGRIACEKVVVCAGMWTRPFCAAHGVNVPLVPVEHQYIVTERIEGVTSTLPTLRDPDRLTYWKEEVGGLVMGGYEPNPKLWRDGSLPPGFHYTLLDNDFDKAREAASWYRRVFGEDFYLEVWNHEADSDVSLSGFDNQEAFKSANRELATAQKKARQGLFALSKEFGIKVIASNDVHFVNREDAIAQDTRLCISTGKKVNDADRLRYSHMEFLRSESEMRRMFGSHPEAIDNTQEILDKVERYSIYADPVIPSLSDDPKSELRKKVYDGAISRYGKLDDEVNSRIVRELDAIGKNNCENYFLLWKELVDWTRSEGRAVGS